jgi:drug/metabolite transporter (DMT)-like permease
VDERSFLSATGAPFPAAIRSAFTHPLADTQAMFAILCAILAGLCWGVGEIFTKGAINECGRQESNLHGLSATGT